MTATTKKLTVLTNSFHNTTVRTRYTPEQLEAVAYRVSSHTATPAERAAVRRISNALCGVEGCCCGNTVFSERA